VNREIKFRFWSPPGKAFVQQYKYSGLVDELFEQDNMLLPSQFTGVHDSYQNEIWEGDIVEVERQITKNVTNTLIGSVDFLDGAFLVLAKSPESNNTLTAIWLHEFPNLFNFKLKVIGNKFETPSILS
jgi:hypothetical protein